MGREHAKSPADGPGRESHTVSVFLSIFPAQCNDSIQHLRLTETQPFMLWYALFSTFKFHVFFFFHVKVKVKERHLQLFKQQHGTADS